MALAFPSSAIQVLEQLPTRLVVIDPPYYVLGYFFLGLGGMFCGLAFVGKLLTPKAPTMWILVVLGLPFFLVGLVLSESRTTTTLSRESGDLVIATSRLGMEAQVSRRPLQAVDHAIVETGDGSRRLVLLLRTGEALPTSNSFTDREGYYEAAAAINRFLAVSITR